MRVVGSDTVTRICGILYNQYLKDEQNTPEKKSDNERKEPRDDLTLTLDKVVEARRATLHVKAEMGLLVEKNSALSELWQFDVEGFRPLRIDCSNFVLFGLFFNDLKSQNIIIQNVIL